MNQPYKLMPLDRARWRLAVVWFSSSGVIFVVLIFQSFVGAYENKAQGAWGWALPNFLPTLALMLSVFAADALKAYDDDQKVREPFYKLSMGLSIFYLAILFASLALQPIILTLRHDPKFTPMDILQLSNLWLGPLQSLVVGAIGVLFFLQQNSAPGSAAAASAATGASGAVAVDATAGSTKRVPSEAGSQSAESDKSLE